MALEARGVKTLDPPALLPIHDRLLLPVGAVAGLRDAALAGQTWKDAA